MSLTAKLKHYWKSHTLPVAILTLLSGVLLLADLGDGYLWQDEAQSALVSRSVLIYGVPKATDGKNSFAQVQDAEYGANKIWKFHPWLPFYATAASYAVLGESTFSARLPSALAGICTVVFLYFLAFKLTRDQRTAFLSGLLLTLSVAFLLLTTQCRYYGLSIGFSVLGALGFLRLIRGEKGGFWLFLISTFLLFHSHYIYCASLFISLLIYTWFFARDQLTKVVKGMAIVTVVNIPAIIWHGNVEQKNEGEFLAFNKTFDFLSAFTGHIDQFLVPGPLLLFLGILAGVGLLKTSNSKPESQVPFRTLALPAIFSVMTMVLVAVLVHKPYFRYIGPVLPFFFLILAVLIRWSMVIHWLVGIGLIGVWLATGDLKKYMQEMTQDYYGPMEGITQFLNQYAKPTDTVAIPFGDLPVKFYTDLHVIGGLSDKDYKQAVNADWIILRKNSIMEADAQMKEYLVNNLNMDLYRQTKINYPDIPYQNREVPNMHHFKPVRNAPKVRILKRVDTVQKADPQSQPNE